MQEQSVLRMLLQNNAPDMNQNAKGEFSPETGFSTDISSAVSNHDMAQRSFKDYQEDPSTSAGPVDVACLWSY